MKRPRGPSQTPGPGAGFPFSLLANSGTGTGATDDVETPLDANAVHDVLQMWNEVPSIKVSYRTLLSMVLPGPFSWSIPALHVDQSPDMEPLIMAYWMPWAREAWGCAKKLGVVPYYFVNKGGHKVPMVCDLTQGYITVTVNTKTRARRFNWYDTFQDNPMRDAATDIFWIVTEDAPSGDGTLRSALASLLPTYRSLLKLRHAQDVVSTQRAHPTHIIERRPDPKAGQDDNLMYMSAEYGKAAGIGKDRLEEARQAETRLRAAQLKAALRETQQRNLQQSTVKQVLWTDTPASMLDEMDAGFSNRVVVLHPNCAYKEGAKPEMIGDYLKTAKEFDVMAAAVMDSNIEFFTPSGGFNVRAHQGQLIDRFTNGRVRDQSMFFKSIIHAALVIAYKPQFRQIMDAAYRWRLSRGEDASQIVALHPELDVEVHMPTSSVVSLEELMTMRDQGLIKQDTMARYEAQAKNMPMEDFVSLKWPDNVPEERLVRPAAGANKAGDGSAKPPKKKSTPGT